MTRRTFLAVSPGLLPLLKANAAEATVQKKLEPQIDRVLARLESTQTRFYNVPRKDGEFLHLVAQIARAKNVLEIGTANGYSAMWLALALRKTGGRLTSIEINPELVKAARGNLKEAGLDRGVTVLEGDAHEVITRLEGPFDLVFIDAELGGKMDYFHKLYPRKLPAGSLLICHNVIKYRSAMEDYLSFIQQHKDFDSVILSLTMDDGFSVSLRKLS